MPKEPVDSLFRYLERPGRARLAAVVREHHEFVWEVAFRVTRHREDAADIAQDVFLKLLIEPPRPEEVRNARGFLAWRVLGRARYLQRAAERRRRQERDLAQHLAREGGLDEEEARELLAAVATLPEELRLVLELHYLAGMPSRRIGAALELGERAVRLRLEKGRALLRRRLGRTAPVLALGGTGDPCHPAAPETLLPCLLEIARSGSAVVPRTTSESVREVEQPGNGGSPVMARMLVLGGALLVLLPLAFVIVDRDEPVDRDVVRSEGEPIAREVVRAAEETMAAAAPAGIDNPPVELREAEPPRATLRGVVLSEDGVPLAGVRVLYRHTVSASEVERLRGDGFLEVVEGKVAMEAVTDEAGTFVVTDVLPSRGALRVEDPVLYEGYAEVEIRSGEEPWYEIGTRSLRRLGGTIRNQDGVALPGALAIFRSAEVDEEDAPIQLANADEWPPFHPAFRADEEGSYDTGYRLRGFVECIFWAEGYALALPRAPRFEGLEAHLDVELVAEMPVVLYASDEAGNAIEGACASIDEFNEHPALGCSDAQGRLEVEHLPRREWTLRVSSEGYHAATVDVGPATGTEAVVTLRAREETDAAEGADEPGEVSEPRPPWVAGLVVEKGSERPLVGVTVEAHYTARDGTESRWSSRGPLLYFRQGRRGRAFLFPSRYPHSRDTVTDDEGRFLIELPAEHPWTVVVNARNERVWHAGADHRELWWSAEVALDVDVTARVEDLRVEVGEGGTLEGVVLGADGEAVRGQVVAVYDGYSVRRCQRTEVAGGFRFQRLRAGAYAVEVLGRSTSAMLGSTGMGVSDVDGLPDPADFFERRVRVDDGETTAVVLELPRDGLGVLEARHHPEVNGGKLIYAMVVGGRPRMGSPFGGEADVSGSTFRLDALFPGRYRLWLFEGDDGLRAEAAVVVTRGVTRLDLTPVAGTLVVPLPHDEGARIEGFRIAAIERWTDLDVYRPWKSVSGFEVRPAAGGLRVDGVLAGRLRVTVIAPGYVQERSPYVELLPDAALELAPFELARGAEIRVELATRSGRSVPEDLEWSVWSLSEPDYFPSAFTERRQEDGVRVLSAFAPGSYRVSVEGTGVRSARASGEVEVRDTEPVLLQLTLSDLY